MQYKSRFLRNILENLVIAVISSSLERLAKVRDGMMRTRPIVGNSPRSVDSLQDHVWSAVVLSHTKVRTMQIIAELEQTGRGAYTGSMGYLNHDGSMDLNILIRTLVQNGRHIRLRAGGGIVADSDPLRELRETQAKAAGLLAALTGPAA